MRLREDKLTAAVAVIFDGPEILLGKKDEPGDELHNKWVFPGGHINPGEDPIDAAVREAKEETNLTVVPVEGVKPYIHEEKPHVVFVKCQYVDGSVKANHEFSAMQWYDLRSLPKGMLSMNIDVLKHYNDAVSEMIMKFRQGEHVTEIIMQAINR